MTIYTYCFVLGVVLNIIYFFWLCAALICLAVCESYMCGCSVSISSIIWNVYIVWYICSHCQCNLFYTYVYTNTSSLATIFLSIKDRNDFMYFSGKEWKGNEGMDIWEEGTYTIYFWILDQLAPLAVQGTQRNGWGKSF